MKPWTERQDLQLSLFMATLLFAAFLAERYPGVTFIFTLLVILGLAVLAYDLNKHVFRPLLKNLRNSAP